jgi:hypothetical protein
LQNYVYQKKSSTQEAENVRENGYFSQKGAGDIVGGDYYRARKKR